MPSNCFTMAHLASAADKGLHEHGHGYGRSAGVTRFTW
jgi:hypothetical protein